LVQRAHYRPGRAGLAGPKRYLRIREHLPARDAAHHPLHLSVERKRALRQAFAVAAD
jgi:hypothetical protein